MLKVKTLIGIIITAVVLFGGTAAVTSAQNRGSQPDANLVISPDEDYLIGSSDVIEVKVEDAPELSGTFRLSSKGTFTLPVVGQVTAEKKKTDEVAQIIADKLRGGYLVNPNVIVSVKQSNSRTFFIQGAVRSPGIYKIEGRPSLLKLITVAGGLADNHGSTAFVMREKKQTAQTEETVAAATVESVDKTVQPTAASGNDQTDNNHNIDSNQSADAEDGTEYDLIKPNINSLLRGNLEQNVIIQPGDIVHIPQTDVFFVAGEVKAPGSFPLKDGTTLRQAISLAQGTNFQGATDRGIIFREDQTGKRQEIVVDIKNIMAGKKDDVDILANDIIMVPNSQKKTVAKSVIKSLGSTLPAILLRGLGIF